MCERRLSKSPRRMSGISRLLPPRRNMLRLPARILQQRASVNHGTPAVAATPKPGALNDRAAIPAKQGGKPYNAPVNRAAAQPPANAPAAQPEKNAPRPETPATNAKPEQTERSPRIHQPPSRAIGLSQIVRPLPSRKTGLSPLLGRRLRRPTNVHNRRAHRRLQNHGPRRNRAHNLRLRSRKRRSSKKKSPSAKRSLSDGEA